MSAQPDYLIPPEVAVILRRSLKTTYRLMDADPSFPRTKLPGGGVLVPRVAFERWLQDRTEGTKHPVRLSVVARTSDASATHSAPHALNGVA